MRDTLNMMTKSADPSQICILWHRAERAPCASLVRVLGKRGFSVMPTTSGHTAFAAACRCSKAAKRVVLVLEERETLGQLDRVLDALDRFAPSVICWAHQPGANPPMVPIVRNTSPISEPSSEPSTDQSTAQSKTPTQRPLRLVGNPVDEQAQGSSTGKPAKSTPINARDVLDAEELEALLAGELGNGRKGT